jgi:hypothetical protein
MKLALTLLVLCLTGCQTLPPTAAAPVATALVAPVTASPTLAPTTTITPQPTIKPTATPLWEGVQLRLGTPDPSPDCPDHYPWFFDNHARECASIVLNTWGAVQPFEHGLMVWIAEGGHTYILLDDGSAFKPYREVTDTGSAYQTDRNLNLIPPPGFYPVILGFAKFWRGLVPGTEWIREQLGWATAPETDYSIFWQCNTASDESARCYFSGPQNEIIVMTRGSVPYWSYWQVPAP